MNPRKNKPILNDYHYQDAFSYHLTEQEKQSIIQSIAEDVSDIILEGAME